MADATIIDNEIGAGPIPPLRAALGSMLDDASPKVRDHFSQASGTRRYRGVMSQVRIARGWRGLLVRPVLWLCRRYGLFLADSGTNVPFELEHHVQRGRSGTLEMIWSRVLHFDLGDRRFEGVLGFDPARRLPIEWLGAGKWIEAELHCQIEAKELHTVTGRQWLRIGPLRLPIPRILAGRAILREWQRDDETLGTTLRIIHPILGEVIGWDGWFASVLSSP